VNKHVKSIYKHVLGSKFVVNGQYKADGVYTIRLKQMRKTGRNRGVVRTAVFSIEGGRLCTLS
jgi:hypothetical protein